MRNANVGLALILILSKDEGGPRKWT
jgi:hypothetical protein